MDDGSKAIGLSNEERHNANQWLIGFLQQTLTEGREDIKRLRIKLAVTYWVLIVLSIIMFCVGIGLISVPLVKELRSVESNLNIWHSAFSAGVGLIDLTGLFLFRPIERIHRLMGDMSQLTVAIQSFQDQVALRLMASDAGDRDTMGAAAEEINSAAKASILSIEKYFESKKN